jgi:plasmid maintenance system antidote protein VapI
MSHPKKKAKKQKPISHALRDTLRKRGLTAYAAAKQAGVSVDAVQRFINDERSLSLGTVDKIAHSLDLTLCGGKTPKRES